MTLARNTKAQATSAQPDLATLMAGVLAILVAEREERLNGNDEENKPVKTELLLANAGLSTSEIAQLMDKNADAVRKTIQRARK